MDSIKIKAIDISQLDHLRQIAKHTFLETYAAQNREENINDYLKNAFSIKQLSSELANKNSTFYFVELEKSVIGYMKLNLSDAQTENQNENGLEIERIYILKEFQGKNIGRTLCTKAIEVAKQHGVDFVWLGVWEKNPKAIKFYQKNGFIAFDKHIFRFGDEDQTDIMMKIELNELK